MLSRHRLGAGGDEARPDDQEAHEFGAHIAVQGHRLCCIGGIPKTGHGFLKARHRQPHVLSGLVGIFRRGPADHRPVGIRHVAGLDAADLVGSAKRRHVFPILGRDDLDVVMGFRKRRHAAISANIARPGVIGGKRQDHVAVKFV